MSSRTSYYRKTARRIEGTCGLLFILFAFFYLLCSQDEVIGAAQNILSHGLITYKPFMGAVIITFLLMLLQRAVARISRLPHMFHALTYIPSCICLIILCDVCHATFDPLFSADFWYWLCPLLLALYALVAWALHALFCSGSTDGIARPYLAILWPNILAMAFFCGGVGGFCHTPDVTIYALQAQEAILRGDFDEALGVGRKSLVTNRALSAFRAYALSRQGKLGERLFEYPQPLHSEGLLLPRADTLRYRLSPDSIYAYLGAVPCSYQNVPRYLDVMAHRKHPADQPVADYWLCSLLLDKKLDLFANQISRYYILNDSLPKHYREALILYRHLRTKPTVVYQNAVEEANYNDFQTLCLQYRVMHLRANAARREFGNTYYYYYLFQR